MAEGHSAKKSIDVQRAFYYIFDNPAWLTNLLLVLVCMFIPVVGPIVFMGYQFELISALLDRPKDMYPTFDFGRFKEYLMRGVWPFVAGLIAQLVLTPIIMVFVFPVACIVPLSISLAEEADAEALGIVCMAATWLLMFVGITAINVIAMLIMTPMMLGAGLAEELGPAIDFGFIKDFLGRTWKSLFAAYLWLFLAMMLLMPLGILACFVGSYVIAAWAWMAMSHVYYQAYLLYLERGGTPIKPKGKAA